MGSDQRLMAMCVSVKGELIVSELLTLEGGEVDLGTWSSLSRALILFWNGYATHLPLIQTYDTRSKVFHTSGPLPTAVSRSSSKYW